MRHVLVVSLLAFGVFSGCVGDAEGGDAAEASEAATQNDPVQPEDVDPNSPFGIVQGSVLTDEQVPVIGALVGLRGTDFQSVTDANGNFLLTDVPPGSYALDAGALGFEAQARQLEVLAGQITSISILLTAIGVADEVYYEIIPHSGYMECALSTAAWISGCSYPYTMAVGGIRNGTCYFDEVPFVGTPLPCVPATGIDLWAMGAPKDVQNNQHRFNITIAKNIGQLQAELVWSPSSAAATQMNLIIVCGDYDWIADDCTTGLRYGDGSGKHGTSPVKNVIERETWEGGLGFYNEPANGTKWDLYANEEIWVMNYVGLPFGCLDLPTVCADGMPYNEFQLAFGQRFDLWDTLFFNGRGPDDWTVLNDS